MKSLNIPITLKDNVPVISSEYDYDWEQDTGEPVGSMWDNGQQQLIFTRPSGYETYELMLLFRSISPTGRAKLIEQNIGTENTYLISNALTQQEDLRLMVAFLEGDAYRGGSNELRFTYRYGTQDGAVPVELENQYNTLFKKVIVNGATDDDNVLTFINNDGEEVFSVQIPNATLEVGTVTTSTLAPGESATVDLTYDGKTLTGIFSIPQGKQGETGTTGAAGNNGADGVSPTITVKENTSTSYVLTLTDKDGAIDTPNLKGADGTGAGDMQASVYDPQGKAQDAFAYTDKAIANLDLKEGDMKAETYDPQGKSTDTFAYADKVVETHATAIASASTLGHVKIGSGITVSEDGTISANEGASLSFVYECTDTEDSTAIATIVNNFFNNGTAMNMKLIITGTMGIAFTSTYYAMYINATNTRGARVFLDFSDCYIPEITTASRDFLYVEGGAILDVFGLVASATRYGVHCNSTSTNNISNCVISSNGSYGVYCASTSTNNISNCVISSNYGVCCNSTSTNNISNCVISSGSYGVYCASTSTNNISNCVISSSSGYGVYCASSFSGILTLNNCKSIGSIYGTYSTTANTTAVIKLTDCQIKGGTQDVYQNTAASTMHWLIRGCSFAGANIYVNGATVSVSSTVANAYLAIQAYHNLFSQTIE